MTEPILMSVSALPPGATIDGHGYDEFRAALIARFAANTVENPPLFTTTASGLFDAFLDALPAERQHYTCNACRRFFDTYGGLVTIDGLGRTQPVFWNPDDVPGFFREAVSRLRERVAGARVAGVFLTSQPVWGQPQTGSWSHFAVTPPSALVYTNVLLTAGQKMAERLEDYRLVQHGLTEFSLPLVQQAVALLESEALYRAEKVIGPARWLNALHTAQLGLHGLARENVVWRAVATAPSGFCHPRSSMVGTLLEDLASGSFSFEQVAARFQEKMNPTQYQRPQAAPSAGNIAQAEKIVQQLGLARSLERRFARLEEVTSFWKPQPSALPASDGSVFGHLQPKEAVAVPTPLQLPPATMTWRKFEETVLGTAEALEFNVPAHGSFMALVTAVHPDAPPILQWDLSEQRNPFSSYVYTGGSPASQWRLSGGSWCPVTALSRRPHQWGPNPATCAHQVDGVLLLLREARDTRTGMGIALFPEILKTELRSVRATLEAYSRGAELGGRDEASACGAVYTKSSHWPMQLRVRSGSGWRHYHIDRWD